MSMDPKKWVSLDKLSARARERLETVYPYLKLDNCEFQEKHSGVFMKQINNVKIEKLLDPEGKGANANTVPSDSGKSTASSGKSSGSRARARVSSGASSSSSSS